MHQIDTAERRRRIGARHRLAKPRPKADLGRLADDLAGIHATDPASVYMELRARTRDLRHDDVERALYDERTLVKVLGMRRTMFVVSPALRRRHPRRDRGRHRRRASASARTRCSRARASRRTRRAGSRRSSGRPLDALHELGEATASDLTKRVPGLREQISFGEGKTWAGTVGVSTRLLFLLAAEGRIIRGRPRGTWLSSLYRWVPMDRWVEGGLEPWPAERAQAELVRHWLRAFGPGTQRDIQWWTGWTVARTKAALRAVGSGRGRARGWRDRVDAAGRPRRDARARAVGRPPARARLDDHGLEGAGLVPRTASTATCSTTRATPARRSWVDGRVVGLWAQRANMEVGYRLLEDVGREHRRATRCGGREAHRPGSGRTACSRASRTRCSRPSRDS